MKEIAMGLDMKFAVGIKDALALSRREEAVGTHAFQAMLYPHKEHLYNFVQKSLNFCEDANDVFQETVTRAFKYRAGFKADTSFKTWLFAIAYNEIKRYYKKQKQSDGLENLEIADDADSVDRETVRDIYDAARELKPKEREVFFLFYDRQFSLREIGEITGLREGNIKFILNRARGKIRDKLGVRDNEVRSRR